MQNASPIKKQIWFFAALLALLAAVIFVRTQPDPQVTPERHLLGFKQEDVKSFRINHFTSSLLFQKQGESWQVRKTGNDFTDKIDKGEIDGDVNMSPPKKGGSVAEETDFVDADPAAVSRTLTTLFELMISEPVATQAKLPDFRINPHSLHILFYGEGDTVLGRLNIGKQGADMFSSFVTLGESQDVYAVEQNLNGLVNRSFEDWQPKKETATQTATGTAKKKTGGKTNSTKKKKRK